MAGTPWAPKSFRICCTIASQSDKDSRPQHGYPAIKATEEWLSSHQGQKRSGYPAIIEQKWLSSHQIFPETNRFSLKITGFHWKSKEFIEIHGNSCEFMGLHGSSWVFMGLHGSSWVFMRLHVNFASFLSFFPGAFLSSSPATIFISLPVSVQAIQPYFTSSDCCFAICALAIQPSIDLAIQPSIFKTKPVQPASSPWDHTRGGGIYTMRIFCRHGIHSVRHGFPSAAPA